jgi:iron-sulfur cluster assembly protein
MLELTESAAEAIKRVVTGSEGDVMGLRIIAFDNGCAGFHYRMGLDTDVRGDDKIIELNGVKLLVDAESQILLAGTEIDFREDTAGAGFVFNNPNTPRKCSCDKSCKE